MDTGVRSSKSVFSLSVAHPSMGTFHRACREKATKSREKGVATCDAVFSVLSQGIGGTGIVDGGMQGERSERDVVSTRPVLVIGGEDSVVRALWMGGCESVSPRSTRMPTVHTSPQLNSMRTS